MLIALPFFSCKKNDDSPTTPPAQNFLSASAASLTLNGSLINSKDSLNIESNVNWSISVSPSSVTWFTPSITSGNGNSKVYITVTEMNNTGVERAASIVITAIGNSTIPSVTVQIRQAPQSFTALSKLFGGTQNDQFQSVIKASDGGYVIAGYTHSNNGDLTTNAGDADFWMAKINSGGTILWSKTLGGSNIDIASSVVESADGGYVFAGQSSSSDGDFSGGHGSTDIWAIKLNVNGSLVWKKAYGGSGFESCNSDRSITLAGNDFVLSGGTSSNDGDVTGLHNPGSGNGDAWVFKINSTGNIIWQKCLGGSAVDQSWGVTSITGGGFIVSAISLSSDGDATNNKGLYDFWAIKLNDNGSIIWQKNLGGSGQDFARSIVGTPDGGCAITGSTESTNGDVTGNHGIRDIWVIKLDGNGNLNWQKCLGGTNYEDSYGICLNSSGGYMVTGYTLSTNGDVSGGYTKPDAWLVEIDGSGNKLWQKSIGGSGTSGESGVSVALLSTNDEFIMAGYTSSNDGDVSGFHGVIDGWLYKFKP